MGRPKFCGIEGARRQPWRPKCFSSCELGSGGERWKRRALARGKKAICGAGFKPWPRLKPARFAALIHQAKAWCFHPPKRATGIGMRQLWVVSDPLSDGRSETPPKVFLQDSSIWWGQIRSFQPANNSAGLTTDSHQKLSGSVNLGHAARREIPSSGGCHCSTTIVK
jgi:hypothetical protein